MLAQVRLLLARQTQMARGLGWRIDGLEEPLGRLSDEDAEKLRTVGDAVAYLEAKVGG